jgi:septal ring factor EnvC (AmiA/AmiB activator)
MKLSEIKFHRFITLALISALLFICAPVSGSDIVEQKGELEKIKNEIESSEKRLDSLKNIEQHILKDVSNYEQKASMDKTVIRRLNNQLTALRKDIGESKAQFDKSTDEYISRNDRFLNNLKHYYYATGSGNDELNGAIKREKDAFEKLVYLRSLASYDKGDVFRAKEYLATADEEYAGLVNQEKSVGSVRDKKRNEYTINTAQKEIREKDLSKLRRKKESEADKLITLSAAAQQMEDLISRLENARLARARAEGQTQFDFNTGNFASYKGGLLAPLKGKILRNFGWKTDPVTKLKSFSPGIEIRGNKHASVIVIAEGVVTYIGNLRGYGNFVIVEHEDGFYSTYAGLDNLKVVQNQLVGRGKILGQTPTGIVKFELRQGRMALDPIMWVKIDSFK